jgi:hypothetical protein
MTQGRSGTKHEYVEFCHSENTKLNSLSNARKPPFHYLNNANVTRSNPLLVSKRLVQPERIDSLGLRPQA